VGFKAVTYRIIKTAVSIAWFARLVGPVLIGYYESRGGGHHAEWSRKHPFDQLHAVDTSGFVPGFLLTLGFTSYAAAQPGIIRQALTAIPAPQQCRFLDLGCGKGRPLLVATEFGFPAITGVEVSPGLARIARRNAGISANAYPDRTRINIVTADATKYRLPAENLVIFLYNPFDGPLVARLLGNIVASLLQSPRTLYIVYYNPVFAGILDASPALERRYAAQIPYDPGELGYGPDTSDAVVIWQNRGNPNPIPPGRPDAAITIVIPSLRAELAA
jgi:SAM-dependent methyltransferase